MTPPDHITAQDDGLTARLTRITDPFDPRIADYRDVRDRDLKGRAGLFMAEGAVVMRDMARSARFAFESVLIAQNRVPAMAAWIAALPDAVPVYVAEGTVMDAIAGFAIHRGILALARRGEPLEPGILLEEAPADALVVACFGITNHDNLGGIFRNAAAFGAAAILLDPQCCDPLYRKALRVSVGAAARVPFARLGPGPGDAGNACTLLCNHGFEPLALSPRGTLTLAEAASHYQGRRALLLGSEGPGLAPDLIAAATSVRIDMAGDFDSLNVATTSGIALYALTRQPGD
ncbi:RNA methyltransferase [Saliniramus sp.]|uniref:TrmH family RNA methyltransferase n=1 Tax=Saliniramus sp. TaxID=2986772 RepID=UPI002C6976BA|nr:RNA methyltransferase [Saliniramus sp.]HMB09871.1 RNA methyltransferase [Saliniramus sp.]